MAIPNRHSHCQLSAYVRHLRQTTLSKNVAFKANSWRSIPPNALSMKCPRMTPSPSTSTVHVSAKPSSHPGQSAFPSPVVDRSFPPSPFLSTSEAQALTSIHPCPWQFDNRLDTLSALHVPWVQCPSHVPDQCPLRTESPFAPTKVLPHEV